MDWQVYVSHYFSIFSDESGVRRIFVGVILPSTGSQCVGVGLIRLTNTATPKPSLCDRDHCFDRGSYMVME